MLVKTFKLSIQSLRFRKFSISLTIFSLAISILLLLSVDTIRVQVKNNFINTISGTDLIVGSRSGSIQLLLYSVFHLGNATNNISWESYKKISQHPRVNWSIPISLGDSHRGYRVIGTNQSFFDHYKYSKNKKLQFKQGHTFSNINDVVIGANVAKMLNYKIGDNIILAHGIDNTNLNQHENFPFKITGILSTTSSPIDKSILIDLKGLEAIHIGWELGISNKNALSPNDIKSSDSRLLPETITAFFLGLKNKHDIFGIQRAINDFKREPLLAILPGITLLELWKVVGLIETILLFIALLVLVTGLLSMLSIILTSLNSRRRELAVLRSVGATPSTILLLIVFETEFLVFLGILLGLVLHYLIILLFNPLLLSLSGITIELTTLTLFQMYALISILVAGLIVSFIPAYSAYKNTLQDGLTIRS